MKQVDVQEQKDSIENHLYQMIKINFKKDKKKDTERKCYKIRSGDVMEPRLTISRPTADSDIRVDTLGAERFGEVG